MQNEFCTAPFYTSVNTTERPHPILAQEVPPPLGAALPQRMQSHELQQHKPNARTVSAAPTEL